MGREKHQEPISLKGTVFRGGLVAILFALVSTSVAFVDKSLLSSFHFNYPYFIMACQMLLTITVLELLRFADIIHLPAYSLTRGWSFIVPSTCYWLNAVLSLIALSGMNIPMFGVVRRCQPLALLFLAVMILHKRCPTLLLSTSVFMITAGSIIAGYGDKSFNLYAYSCGLGSVITQALYLVLIEKLCASELTLSETLHLNSCNTFPILVLLSFINAEPQGIEQYSQLSSFSFIVLFITVISLGCLLNYTTFLCTSVNSALTTSVVGMLKSLAQSGIGLYAFGGVTLNVWTGWGLGVNLMGGMLYTFARYKEKLATVSMDLEATGGKERVILLKTAYQRHNPPRIMTPVSRWED